MPTNPQWQQSSGCLETRPEGGMDYKRAQGSFVRWWSFILVWVFFHRCSYIPNFILEYMQFIFLKDTSNLRTRMNYLFLKNFFVSFEFSVYLKAIKWHFITHIERSILHLHALSSLVSIRGTKKLLSRALHPREKADSNLGSPFASCLALGNLLTLSDTLITSCKFVSSCIWEPTERCSDFRYLLPSRQAPETSYLVVPLVLKVVHLHWFPGLVLNATKFKRLPENSIIK